MEKKEPSCTVGGNANRCSHCGKQYGSSSKKKKKVEIPYDLVISLLGIYTKKTKMLIQKDMCIPLFFTALLT